MTRRFLIGAGTALIVLISQRTALAAALRPVRILSPAPDSVVRERVKIEIDSGAVPDNAYMVVHVDGKFLAAVARPMSGPRVTYVWDTKGSSTGQDPVPDGRHQIRVMVTDEHGKQVGNTDSVWVTVKNGLDSVPSSVVLAYRFRPEEQRLYSQRTIAKSADVELFSNHLIVKRTCDDVMPGGAALIREKIERSSRQTEANQTIQFYKAGRSLVMTVTRSGDIRPGRRMERLEEQAALQFIRVPSGPLRIGSTWSTGIRIPLFYQGVEVLELPTAREAEKLKGNWVLALAKNKVTHTLKGFEWQNGYPTAKVVTEYDGTAIYRLPGSLTPALFPITGKRTTFFDFKRGRVVRMEDKFSVDLSGASGASLASTGVATSPGGAYNPYSAYRTNPYAAGPYGRPGGAPAGPYGAPGYPGAYATGTGTGTGTGDTSTRTQMELTVSLIG
ncbi:MAG: hypothetical protein ACUVTZ_07205 [Armatimonadota bacterium]